MFHGLHNSDSTVLLQLPGTPTGERKPFPAQDRTRPLALIHHPPTPPPPPLCGFQLLYEGGLSDSKLQAPSQLVCINRKGAGSRLRVRAELEVTFSDHSKPGRITALTSEVRKQAQRLRCAQGCSSDEPDLGCRPCQCWHPFSFCPRHGGQGR